MHVIVGFLTDRLVLALVLLLCVSHPQAKLARNSGIFSQGDVVVPKSVVVTKRDVSSKSGRELKWCYQSAACRQGAGSSGWEQGLCKTGKAQSPINLDLIVKPPSDPHSIYLGRRNIANFTLETTRGTITLTPSQPQPQTASHDDPNHLPPPPDFFWDGDHAFSFNHLEFHWGPWDELGSEHALDGRSTSMEMHLVYFNSLHFRNYAEAVDSGGKGALAIIGVLLVADPNKRVGSILSPIVSNLEQLAKKGGGDTKKVDVDGDPFPLNNFLTRNSYAYAYNGSLTTPPCQEVVYWIVVRNPAVIKPSDVEAFRKAVKDEVGNPMKMNYRKLQPLNTRNVQVVMILTSAPNQHNPYPQPHQFREGMER